MNPVFQRHKVFLYWLLYASVLVYASFLTVQTGIISVILKYDHSHLSVVLTLMFVTAIASSALGAVTISGIQSQINTIKYWLKNKGQLLDIVGSSIVHKPLGSRDADNEAVLDVTNPYVSRYLDDMLKMSDPNCKVLLECFEARLYSKINLVVLLSSTIVWVGILATIIGVIMAFWPFINQGVDVDQMKQQLGPFFNGIAVAFIPTAISFVFKILLDVNLFILENAIADSVVELTSLTETDLGAIAFISACDAISTSTSDDVLT